MIQVLGRLIRRNPAAVLGMVSVFLIQLITNLTSSWLESAFGQTSAQLIQVIIVLSTLAAALYILARVTRLIPRQWSSVPHDLLPSPRQGLILIVGPGRAGGPGDIETNPAYIAADYHRKEGKLKAIWAVTTNEGMSTLNHLKELFQPIPIQEVMVYNEHSLAETYRAVERIYSELIPKSGIPPEEVIADITGGTKEMSVGLALASANLLPMQFVSGLHGSPASEPMQTDFQPARREAPSQEA